MKLAELVRIATLTLWIALVGSRNGVAQGVAPGGLSIESINTEYDRELLKLERIRLEQIGKLALSQPRDQAEATLDTYFRLAITKNLYADAEPIAKKVIQSGDSRSVTWLAYLVEIVGQADQGAYEESLATLAQAIKLKGAQAGAKEASLSVGTKASLIDAYFQRLVHADQLEVARKAMKLIIETSDVPAIRDLAARRFQQLDIVGKPFKLEDNKGEVVLVVFWATWCLPNAQEMPWIDYLERTYKSKGLRVVGINLDSAQHPSKGAEASLPSVRRFLLDYNVTWPILMNGKAPHDYAAEFHVTEIPANVLIGRDGKVHHIDLTGRKLEKAIVSAIAEKP